MTLVGEIAGAFDTLPGLCASLCEGLRPHAPASAAQDDVQVFEGERAVEAAAPVWRALEAAGGALGPFQSYALAAAAAPVHLVRGERPLVIVVREGGRPMVLFPGVVGRWGGVRTLRFLGDPLIQYGDIVAAPGARPGHLAAAWSAAVSGGHASLIYLRKVRADAAVAPLLRERAAAVAHDAAPFVDVSSGAARHGRDERELRRFRRRLAERGAVQFTVSEGEDARARLRQAIELKRRWLAKRDLASKVIGDRFWEEALAALAGSGSGEARLAVASLDVGGRAAAIEVGLVHGRSWHAFLGATDPDFARAGPGQVLMAETIAHCREAGLAVYDLLPPLQPYKQAMATGTVAVADYALPLGLAGRLAQLAVRLKPGAKRAFAAMPPSLRRLIAAP